MDLSHWGGRGRTYNLLVNSQALRSFGFLQDVGSCLSNKENSGVRGFSNPASKWIAFVAENVTAITTGDDRFRELIDEIFDDAGAEWLRSQR